ncbi:MAG: hypothetical protein JXQ76_10490 [Campylobacterales bacterium]|nr:hypothetical protein [Campylobacterales bacterium]
MKRLVKLFTVIGLLLVGSSELNAAMTAGKWKNEWTHTKKEFQKITGKKSPLKKYGTIFANLRELR